MSKGPESVVNRVLPDLTKRRDEVIAFLRRFASEMSVAELAALGYRQTLPDEELDAIFDEWDQEIWCESHRLLLSIVAEWLDALRRTGRRPEELEAA